MKRVEKHDIVLFERHSTPEYGAALLHFLLAFPVFILLVLGFIDFCRYLAVLVILNYGAHQGLNVAQKIPGVDVDTHLVNWNNSEDVLSYQSFDDARETITTAALEFPLATLVGTSDDVGGRTAQLIPYVVTDVDGDVYASQAIFLRPGEHIEIRLSNSGTIPVHPTRSLPITSNENFRTLMRSNPLVVELRAQVGMFLPGLDSLTAIGRAVGYRELIISGAYPAPYTIPPTPPPPSSSSTSSSEASSSSSTSTSQGVTSTSSSTQASSSSLCCDPADITTCEADGGIWTGDCGYCCIYGEE